MIRIRGPQDLGAALIFLLVGIAGLTLGAGLPGMQSGGQLGSGTMPHILSWICIGFSGFMLFRAVSFDGPSMAAMPWRAVIMVSLAVVVFGLFIERLGYVPTAVLAPLVASLSLPEMRWKEAILVSLLLGFGTALLFVVLLGQPLPLWWGVQ